MKKLLVVASVLTVAAVRLFASTASVSEQVLTISLDADTAFSAVASAYVEDLKSNAITNITVTGAFTLTADTALAGYEGTWLVTEGSITASVADAFGSGDIEIASQGVLGITVGTASNPSVWSNNVYFSHPDGYGSAGYNFNPVCVLTWHGNIVSESNLALRYAPSTTTDGYIDGDIIVRSGKLVNYVQIENRYLHLNGVVSVPKVTGNTGAGATGCLVFANPSNSIPELVANYGFFTLAGANVMTNAVIKQDYAEDANQLRGKLFVKADNVIDRIAKQTGSTATGNSPRHRCEFSANARLTMRGTATDSSDVLLMGVGSFAWYPVEQGLTYTLDKNRIHTLDGALIVSNGILKVTGTASFTKVTAIDAGDDGTFDFDTTNGDDLTLSSLTQLTLGANAVADFHGQLPFQPGSMTLRVQSTSKLKMKAGTYEVSYLFVDGLPVDGTFTSENAPWLEEGVTLIAPEPDVPAVARTWDAGGGDDTRFSNPANWDGDTLPNFSDGSLLVTFAAGSAATVDVWANLKGIRFDAAFDLVPGAGGSMAVGSEGITLASGIVSNDVPTRLDRDQTWTIPTGTTLFQTGALQSKAGDAIRTVTRTGMGTLDLTGAGAASTFAGSFAIRSGTMYVRGEEPFGAGRLDGLDKIAIQDKDGETKVWFCGMRTTKPIDEYDGNNKSACWQTQASTTNEFAGSVKFIGTHRPNMGDKSVTVFSGGGSLTYFVFEGSVNADIIFREKPISLSGQWQSWPRVTSECTGSTVVMNLRYVDGGKITLKAPDALFGRTATGGYKYSTFVSDNVASGVQQIELGGYPQTIGDWHMLPAHASKNSLIENSSETPSDLHMVQSRVNAMWITNFKGKINLFKEGTAAVVLTNRAVEAVGTINVVSGSLAFAHDASWLGASNVTVSAGAKLSIAQSATFGRKAEIVLPDEASAMTLGEGTTQTVRWITVGGTRLAVGYYGGPETTDPRVPAENKLAVFAGTGSVFVRGIPGIMLMLR